MRAHASGLNPDAGDHGVTGDPRELAAALRASQRSFEEFPYYRWRYGDRGARFGNSDSGWLASLCRLPAAGVRQQVKWLGAVLSSRGMPQILLERHLLLLHEELVAAVAEKRREYVVFKRCANDLRKQRIKAIPERKAAAIAAAFLENAPKLWVRRIPEMGSLLAAAVADERNGIERAVISIEEWAYDSERFPVRWIEAVQSAITAARGV